MVVTMLHIGRPEGGGIANRVTILQVQDWGKVALLAKHAPNAVTSATHFWFGLSAGKSLSSRLGNLIHFSCVGTIFLHPDTAYPSQLFHETLHCLVVQAKISAVQCCGTASVTISAFVFVVDKHKFVLFPLHM